MISPDLLVPADYGLTQDWHGCPMLLTEKDRHQLDQEFEDMEDWPW